MAVLTVQVDHVAALRGNMQLPYPDPAAASVLAELAGADGISVRWRETNRTLDERDIRLLRQCVKGRFVLQMAPTPEMLGLALDIKPDRVLLLPPGHDDPTSRNGYGAPIEAKTIFEVVDALQAHGIGVGASIAPVTGQVKALHQARAQWVHIHTRRLQEAPTAASQGQALTGIVDTIKMAHRLRLHISVGGALDFRSISLFSGIKEIDAFFIGRSIIARALLVGMDRAVRDMMALIRAL